VVTITVTCYSWTPSCGDHLFTCGAIFCPPYVKTFIIKVSLPYPLVEEGRYFDLNEQRFIALGISFGVSPQNFNAVGLHAVGDAGIALHGFCPSEVYKGSENLNIGSGFYRFFLICIRYGYLI